MIKYILFDFDGTLIDTNELIVNSLKSVCRRFLNKELSQDELNLILGKPLEHQMRDLCSFKYEAMVEYYKELYRSASDEMSREFKGVRKMLEALKKLECKIAIVSAKGSGGIARGLEYLNLKCYIDAVVSAYDVENNKPHPEPAIKALKMLNGNPKEAILVGDSPYDILCGKNAGIRTVMVNWTIFPKQQIIELKPDFIIYSPDDLVKIIKLESKDK